MLKFGLWFNFFFKLCSCSLILPFGLINHFLELVNNTFISHYLLFIIIDDDHTGLLPIDIFTSGWFASLKSLWWTSSLLVNSILHESRIGCNIFITLQIDLLNVNGFFIGFSWFKKLLELFNIIFVPLIFFLLHHQLPYKKLSFIFLCSEFLSKFDVLFDEYPVLVINSLSNRCNELQVMLHLVFSLFSISFLISFKGFFVF